MIHASCTNTRIDEIKKQLNKNFETTSGLWITDQVYNLARTKPNPFFLQVNKWQRNPLTEY